MQKLMRQVLGSALFLGTLSPFWADTFDLDKTHTSIDFAISHMVISKVKGHFKEYSGSFDTDPKGVLMSLNGEIKVASIDTREPKRDDHLRAADFFNAEKFPTMTFKSTRVEQTPDGKLTVDGDFTLLGVTKPINLNGSISPKIKDPWGNEKIGLSLSGKINRQDFGMKFSKALDNGGLMVGNDVELSIEIEGNAKKAEAPVAKAETKPETNKKETKKAE